MKKQKKLPLSKYFLSVDEYCDFAVKNQVFGAAAIKLKIEMDKPKVPLPIIRPRKYNKQNAS